MTTSIFFYSSYCQHCKQVINELTKSPVARSVKYVCIDSKAVREKIPPFIKSVPTIVIGDTNQVLVGNSIKKWIDSQYSKPNVSHKTNEVPRNQPRRLEEEVAPDAPDGPGAWHINEMNNFSDKYSFLDIDTSTQGNGGMSMVHNFELLGKEHNTTCKQTMPGGAPARPSFPTQYDTPMKNGNVTSDFGSIQTSEKVDELNKQMDELLNRREMDIPNNPARI
tara:strand:- start:2431 stop:3096 length:666 start_codon:yes stop_codon:yes gene_type:complete